MIATTSEIDEYVAAVHAALGDLPDAEREDLLEDLPQHLADVQADGGGTLTDVLGTPDAYAAELRATAGLDAAPPTGSRWHALHARLTNADRRIGAMLGYDRFVDLLRALAPAWWLARAYLVVEVCTAASQRSGTDLLVPEIGGNRIAGAVLLVLALVGSVWLGRRGFVRNWQRVTAVVVGIVLAVYGVALVRQATMPTVTYVSDDSSGGYDTSGITNVYPVGPDGTVLTNVRLYDQDGNPIPLGTACDGTTYPDGTTVNADGTVTYPDGSTGGDQTGDGAVTYPLTCTTPGPFPSGHASALSSASATPAPTSVPASPSATPASAATPSSATPSSASATPGG